MYELHAKVNILKLVKVNNAMEEGSLVDGECLHGK